MEYILIPLIIGGFVALYFKKEGITEDNSEELKQKVSELKQTLAAKETEIKQQQQNINIANAKTTAF